MQQIHNCSTELKQAHLAVTPARLATMQLFESRKEPIDAFSLIEYLSKEGIDRVTAFRILNTFVEKGLLRKIELGEGKARYELVSRGDHHHFFCRSCGSIQDIEDTVVPNLIEQLQNMYGFIISNHSLEFFGLCQKCLRGESN